MLATLTLAVCSLCLAADPASLSLNDAAPPIKIEKYLKGESVAKFESGKVYVVEFWATWCGPCIANIPHLSKLQRKYPDVIVLGVSTDTELEAAEQFVKTRGEKMGYRVAFGGDDGAMSEAWIDASGQEGIPAAFLVNQQGCIAWIGHPAELAGPLAAVVKGTWDVAAEKKKYESRIGGERQLEALLAKLEQLRSPDELATLLKVVQLARQNLLEPNVDLDDLALRLMIGLGDATQAKALIEQLIVQAQREQTDQLALVAERLLSPIRELQIPAEAISSEAREAIPEFLKLAVQAAEVSLDILSEGNDPQLMANAADRLCQAYERTGQKTDAIAILETTIDRLARLQRAAKTVSNDLRDRMQRLQGAAGESAKGKNKPGKRKAI